MSKKKNLPALSVTSDMHRVERAIWDKIGSWYPTHVEMRQDEDLDGDIVLSVNRTREELDEDDPRYLLMLCIKFTHTLGGEREGFEWEVHDDLDGIVSRGRVEVSNAPTFEFVEFVHAFAVGNILTFDR